ncbi:hypothetical protein [Aeromicrobium sp. 9AM]|uniref:hypothetical protein n=1 Tax=Aeromicrobium sp. 9AM TaxID=2653126 RepID=UPI0012F3BA7F|nr:hypothetical protein [Aeromicrobium sp. 9AM]VXC21631.1 hypothetical protein AERO9AM_50389 [Aeromicrobium sp. 9AM]
MTIDEASALLEEYLDTRRNLGDAPREERDALIRRHGELHVTLLRALADLD